MSNSIAPGSSADVNVKVTALTTNPNVPVTYKTIILKKNLVNGVNTLTQEMMSATNTKYVIKYDYVFGEDIIVPANCILEFDGGSISAGSGQNMDTITGTNTGIKAVLTKIFNTDITLDGTWNIDEIYPQWFGAKGDEITDDTDAFNALCQYLKKNENYVVTIPKGTYVISHGIELSKGVVKGYGATLKFTCSNESLISFKQTGQTYTYESIIIGLSITTTERNNYTNIGIDMTYTSQIILRDIYVYHCKNGIKLYESTINSIFRPTIEYCEIAVKVETMSNSTFISNADIWENNIGFDLSGYISSIMLSDSYIEENNIDINFDNDDDIETIVNDFVFERVVCYKANLLSQNTDTYVVKTIANNTKLSEIELFFTNCLFTFTPNGRNHFFAYNDAKNKTNHLVKIRDNNNRIYYTATQTETPSVYKTINSSPYMYEVRSNSLKFSGSNVAFSSGSILCNGIDEQQWTSVVNQSLSFVGAPLDEAKKSLFYNQYNDCLQFKDNSGVKRQIAAGVRNDFAAVGTEDLSTLITKFNALLTVLDSFGIIYKT